MVKIVPSDTGSLLYQIHVASVHSTMRTRRTRITWCLICMTGSLLLVILAANFLQEWESFHYMACLMGWKDWSHADTPSYDGKCNVFYLDGVARGAYECVPLATSPSPLICIHDPSDDIYISAAIKDGNLWERKTVALFQEILNTDKELAVIDIGANIGQYSLLGAKMGRTVVAVEAYLKHVQMIKKAVILNRLQENFTLVYNAVSDSHQTVALQFKKENRGAIRVVESSISSDINTGSESGCISMTSGSHVQTILMDDILEVASFRKAIMKMDIEGHEARSMPHSELLLSTVYIPYIFMEWEVMRGHNEEYKAEGINLLLEYMQLHDYYAYSTSRQKLDFKEWKLWPNDIIWRRKDAYPNIMSS